MAHVKGPRDVRWGNGDRVVLGGRALSTRMKPAPFHPVFEDTLLDGAGLPAGGLLEGLASLRVHAADYSHSRRRDGPPRQGASGWSSRESGTRGISPTRQTSRRSSSISTQTP